MAQTGVIVNTIYVFPVPMELGEEWGICDKYSTGVHCIFFLYKCKRLESILYAISQSGGRLSTSEVMVVNTSICCICVNFMGHMLAAWNSETGVSVVANIATMWI